MTRRVLVCDDVLEIAKGFLSQIANVLPEGVYELDPIPTNDEIQAAIQILLRRRKALRERQDYLDEKCLFDGTDVLIIDYDLLHIDEQKTRYTGEGVARLARAFAQCGIVIVLNQYMEAQFDLGLRGHVESFADLNVDDSLIGCDGLWRDGPWTDFRPWHWPVLSKAAINFNERVTFLCDPTNLQRSVAEVLGFTEADASRLSDTAFGFLAPVAKNYDDLAQMTFKEFIRTNSAAVDTSDSTDLIARDPQGCARIAASRVAKWLEREVLGPQDVLVDVPHLLQRCPFLFAGDIADLGAWNSAVFSEEKNVLNDMVPVDAWFQAPHWLNRPALWWRRVEAADKVRKARAKFEFANAPDFVFQEDASRFAPIDEATEFRAGFHNAYDRRFVRKFNGVKYAPQRRFAFGG